MATTNLNPSTKTSIACICVPQFPLQLLARSLPEDFNSPLAVTDREDAGAVIMFVDERAAKQKVHPGLRYATAVTVCPTLHAASVHPKQFENAHQGIVRRLQKFAPGIEPVMELPGAYYLDTRGMQCLAPDMRIWAKNIQEDLLKHLLLRVNIAVGFTRFGVFTAARSMTPNGAVRVFKSTTSERLAARNAPLNLLVPPSRGLKELSKLDVRTVRDLLRLPEREIRTRFNDDLFELVRRAKTQENTVYAIKLPETYNAVVDFEYAQNDVEQLLVAIQHSCRRLLERMQRNGQGVKNMHLRLKLDSGKSETEKLNTSEPTLDLAVITQLLRLRCNTLDLEQGVVGVGIHMTPGPLSEAQLSLDQDLTKTIRELAAADQALAQVCAEFGIKRVLRAKCTDSHLPDESYCWEFFDRMRKPVPSHPQQPSLIRRVYDAPRRIGTPCRTRLKRVLGPYHISGFWWRTTPVKQSHYYVETNIGTTLWIYYDNLARQWYEQGLVQ